MAKMMTTSQLVLNGQMANTIPTKENVMEKNQKEKKQTIFQDNSRRGLSGSRTGDLRGAARRRESGMTATRTDRHYNPFYA